MSAPQWALAMTAESQPRGPLFDVAAEVVATFADGAATPAELPALGEFFDALMRGVPMSALVADLRTLGHEGYLRGAMVAMATAVQRWSRPDVALALGRELMDAIDPALGVRLCQGVLAIDEVDGHRYQPGSTFVAANRILAESLLEAGDPSAALRHFEAVLSVDVEDVRALRGWAAATRALEQRGVIVEHRSRGLMLLEGLDELELDEALGGDRYEIQRPLGRGRHAVVYQAFDRHVGREVALKRLLDASGRSPTPPRVLAARFFAEASTLATVRSPFVVSLLDARPSLRFIALELCRGGNLRLALRRSLVDAADLTRIGAQLRAALAAVHAVGAVHRDVKPANILVRHARRGSSIALADFGLAIGTERASTSSRGGTLRYLAPELRSKSAHAATPASDRFSAGAVLLELALAPAPLPEAFDRMDDSFDAASHVPDDLPDGWSDTLTRLLSGDPEARQW